MANKTREKISAVFIPTGDGKGKLVGHWAELNGVPGLAYIKSNNAIGFKPMAELLEEYTKGMFLTLTGNIGNLSIEKGSQKNESDSCHRV